MTPLEIPEDWLDPFEASPYRLRFELGGDRFGMDAPVPRFVQAFGRARQIVQDLFEAAPRVMGVTRVWDNPSNDLFAPAEDGFQALADAGL